MINPGPVAPVGVFDVAVVGAGPVGLAAALELVARGRSVVVLERGKVAGGTATGSAGMVVPSMITPQAWPGALTDFMRAMSSFRAAVSVRPPLTTFDLWWLWTFVRNTKVPLPRQQAALTAMAELAAESMSILTDWIATFDIQCSLQRRGVLEVV